MMHTLPATQLPLTVKVPFEEQVALGGEVVEGAHPDLQPPTQVVLTSTVVHADQSELVGVVSVDP